MHVFRRYALHLLEQVRVQDHLQQGASLGRACELGIDDFVRPGAERARCFNAQQEVRPAAPGRVEQCALIHDVDAGFHSCDGLLMQSRPFLHALVLRNIYDLGNGLAGDAEVLEIGLLVLEAALAEHVERGVVEIGRVGAALCCPAAQQCELRAAEKVAEIGRKEDQAAFTRVHFDTRWWMHVDVHADARKGSA